MAQFLTSNRKMLRETFLPLDVLDPPRVKERLRQLGGTRRLVTDVMAFDDVYSKVICGVPLRRWRADVHESNVAL